MCAGLHSTAAGPHSLPLTAPRSIGQPQHFMPSANSGKRYTFCHATAVQGLTDIYPVGFFTRILTDVHVDVMSYGRREPGEDHEKCIYIKIKIYYICKYICGVIS